MIAQIFPLNWGGRLFYLRVNFHSQVGAILCLGGFEGVRNRYERGTRRKYSSKGVGNPQLQPLHLVDKEKMRIKRLSKTCALIEISKEELEKMEKDVEACTCAACPSIKPAIPSEGFTVYKVKS